MPRSQLHLARPSVPTLRIVTAPAGQGPRHFGKFGDPAVLRLGSEVEGAADLSGRATQMYLDPEGNLWVADVMTAEVEVFAVPSGEHLFMLGGRGEGPGEFQTPVPLGFDGARAWIWDQDLGRLSVFDVDGELLDVRVIGREAAIMPRILARNAGGGFVAQLPQPFTGTVHDGMTMRDTVRLWEFEEDIANAQLLVARPGITWHMVDRMQVAVPFTDGARFGVRDGRVVLTDADGLPELDVFDEGRLARRVRVDRERMRLTPSDVELALEARPPQIRAVAERMPVPEFVPTWQWVRIGSGGGIFALRYGGLLTDEVWDVFDPEGRLLGSLSLPPNSHLLDVGEEYLITVVQPETEGPRIAVYPVPDWGWVE